MAAVVDPRLDIGEYLRLARYLGVSIEHILETHNHADHVERPRPAGGRHGRADPHPRAGRGRVRARGLRGRLGARRWASVIVRALHTPGHRPEHTAFALVDTARAPGAVGGADRRLAVRGRHRAPGPGGREGGGRARDLRLAARAAASSATTSRSGPGTWAARCAAGRRWTSRCPRRSASSAATTSCCGVDRRGRVRRAHDRRAAPAAAELQVDRGDQPRPAGAPSAGCGAADAAPGRAVRRAGDRHPHRAAVRRGAHPGRDLQHRPAVRASARGWRGSPGRTTRS